MNPVINKFLVAVATMLSVVATVSGGGFTVQEVILIVLTGLGALGVYAVPNASNQTVISRATTTSLPPNSSVIKTVITTDQGAK